MASQDDVREKAQKELFGISDYSETGRSDVYTPDGKKSIGGNEFTIELKTKPECSGTGKKKYGFSTARNFGNKKVEDWRKVNVFIFSEFAGADFNGIFTRHIAISYDDLFPILEKKVLKPYREGRQPRWNSDGYYGMEEFEKNILPLLGNLSPEDVKRVTHTIEVGTSLNDPKFTWNELSARGTMIESEEDLSVFCKGLLSRD